MKKAGRIFLLFIIIITGVLRLTSLIDPVKINDDHSLIDLKIEPGSSSRQIGEKLYQKGLINSKFWFNLLITIGGYDHKLKAGYYELNPSDNLRKIIFDLVKGRVATFKITIPEGFTVEEIAERLAQETFYSKDIFLQEASLGRFNKSFLPGIDAERKNTLEGFLYPNTYIIPKEFTPAQILEVMLTEFENKWWKSLDSANIKGQYNLYELITIASLIEKEAKLNEEKSLIAAVIYNRLQKGMLLQLDATIQYSLAERKKRILYSDLEIDSPYNTYRYVGLPPGPICNPGDSSIKAALNPADVDYLFYFADKEGRHLFSNSYRKHLQLQIKVKNEG